MKKIINIFALIAIIISSSFLLSACTKKTKTTTTETTSNNSVSKETQLSADEKPVISLIPRADGHELKLKLNNIPSRFTNIEYELIYTASDEDLEIEKGVSGTVKDPGSNIERDLLLGTSSCTNGCKYKYDEGVNGGVLTITLTTNDKQYFTFETPFVIKTSSQINKDKSLKLTQENFTVNGTVTSKNDFFIAIKNFQPVYSVFSSGTGTGKITSIEPSTVTKGNTSSFVGDYTIN